MRSSQPHAGEWRHLGVIAIAAGSLLTIGCRTTPKPIEAEPCVGTPYLLVRNSSDSPGDVYYDRGATPYLIGTAGSGPTELTLPPSVEPNGAFRARRPNGQWITPAFGGRQDASRITFQVQCR